ncbi:PilZ domain-containing protein [Sneathiella sp. HT1-7]|uniref:PilZ domain-containing protein n=1 Tax=Sneathiella sp. HT1-7 TaxID=2887192 RepID=UPI001D1516FB|nr:PilZ domain-containing protein [Sneathiella sp. HT1-7]MCC3303387.1 PilZ domain-containing protein [Sneathiella sp. HT1-7]
MKRVFITTGYRGHNRKDHRFEVPKLHLTLGTHEFATYDWSLGGFRIDDFAGRPPVGEKVFVRKIAYDTDRTAPTNSVAVVTRVLLGKNQVAFSFNKLDEAAYDFLEKASMHRLSQLAKG